MTYVLKPDDLSDLISNIRREYDDSLTELYPRKLVDLIRKTINENQWILIDDKKESESILAQPVDMPTRQEVKLTNCIIFTRKAGMIDVYPEYEVFLNRRKYRFIPVGPMSRDDIQGYLASKYGELIGIISSVINAPKDLERTELRIQELEFNTKVKEYKSLLEKREKLHPVVQKGLDKNETLVKDVLSSYLKTR